MIKSSNVKHDNAVKIIEFVDMAFPLLFKKLKRYVIVKKVKGLVKIKKNEPPLFKGGNGSLYL